MDDGRDPEQSGLLQELAGSLAHADPKLLATAALLQGWVLSSVLKKAQEASSGSDAAALLERLKYPVPLPDPQWPSFEPALCLRLQNFAQAEGFREAYLFQGACNLSAPVQRAGADFAWGGAGTFGLDCSLSKPEAALAPAPEPEPSKASWISELSLPSHRRTCTLGVGTEAGSGAMLSLSEDLPWRGGAEMNAMSIRLCNRHVWPGGGAHNAFFHCFSVANECSHMLASLICRALAQGGSLPRADAGADYLLRRLKLNGRPLLPPSGRPVENVVAEDCTTQLYYVKPRSVGSGFALDGALEFPAGGIWPPGTGRGEAASLDIALGQYFFGSAALSILRGDTA